MNRWKTLEYLTAFVFGLGMVVCGFGAEREMRTDRPDVTESPFTIDAGHWQIEMDFANYSRDTQGDARTTEWGAVPFNLRRGLTPDFELGLFVEPFQRETVRPNSGPALTHAGAGDVTLRTKVNFWGNDGGESAFGVIVDLKFPTAARALGNGKTEGTLFFPVNFELPHGWELGAMTALQVIYADTRHYRPVWENTVTLGHSLTANTGAYVEFTSFAGDGPHVSTLDIGATWQRNANTQLDVGVNLGVSRRVPDFLLFTGITRRF